MPLLSKTQFPLQITGFDALYGLEILSLGEEEATARVAVRPEVLQPGGLVHGGVYASIAESLTSFATWKAVSADGRTAQGLSNQTSFLRPIQQRHDPRDRPPPPPRPHHVGVGGRHHRRRGPRVRAGPHDRRGARGASRVIPPQGPTEGGTQMAQQTKADRQAAGQKAAATRQKNEAQSSADEAKKAAGEAVEALVTAAKAGGKAAVQAGKSVSNRAKARKS